MAQRILFSGGGSGGHVVPSLAVAQELVRIRPDFVPLFVCADRPDDLRLIQAQRLAYTTIHAGKFPRGLSLRFLTFPFLFVAGFFESLSILSSERPALVFSKGGFVSVPVCLAAWMRGVPIVLHSSDSVPSMSDRFIGRLAQRVCTGFSGAAFSASLRSKITITGNPVRSIIATGSKDAGKRITGFSGRRPVLMVIGGSQGSKALNEAVTALFPELIELCDIIHLTGEGKDVSASHARAYTRPWAGDDLPHLYALADVVVTRAGAGVLAELAELRKAAVVVPLAGVAHDHQVRNAEVLAAKGAIVHLPQEDLEKLSSIVAALLADEAKRIALGQGLYGAFPSGAAKKTAEVLLDALAG